MKNLNRAVKTGIILLILIVYSQNLLSQTTELIKQIKSGTKFQVVLNYKLGTLVAGKTYDVVYTNGWFSVTGYNKKFKTIGTWSYENADPNLSEISLWGAVYVFDGKGNLYNKDKGLSGRLIFKDWISHITSGLPFQAKLDNDRGTLVAGKVYDVVYTNGWFYVTGYNDDEKLIGTWYYKNADPKLNEISLWGAKYKFDDKGILYDDNNNRCGLLNK